MAERRVFGPGDNVRLKKAARDAPERAAIRKTLIKRQVHRAGARAFQPNGKRLIRLSFAARQRRDQVGDGFLGRGLQVDVLNEENSAADGRGGWLEADDSTIGGDGGGKIRRDTVLI